MTQYADAWFDEFRLWAGAGYAVVWCNPHGSTGYTQDRVRAIRSPLAESAPGTGWGGIDADDVLAALDGALAEFDQLDRDRVGVLGGSYGGYLTSWLAAHHSDRFAAACSERAVNNLESLDWSSDAAGWFGHELGRSWLDAPEEYRRMSPLHHVRGIDVPMLILHSEDDLRCPVEQADALFVALRLLGRPVEYWRFPEESHGMSRTGRRATASSGRRSSSTSSAGTSAGAGRRRCPRAEIAGRGRGQRSAGPAPAVVPVGVADGVGLRANRARCTVGGPDRLADGLAQPSQGGVVGPELVEPVLGEPVGDAVHRDVVAHVEVCEQHRGRVVGVETPGAVGGETPITAWSRSATTTSIRRPRLSSTVDGAE